MYACPRCGAVQGSKKFIGPFCVDCYPFKIRIPDRIEIRQCKRCGNTKLHGKWIPYSEEKLKDYVEGLFRGEFGKVEFDQKESKAKFWLEKDGATAELVQKINFELMKDICPECNKQSGGYFEAIIQLRGNAARIPKYARIFEKTIGERKTFISKIVESRDGLDLYVGSTKVVLAIVKELGLEHKISRKLAGQKQGKRLYRTSFSIRL